MLIVESLELGGASRFCKALVDDLVGLQQGFRLAIARWLEEDGVGVMVADDHEVIHAFLGWDGEPSPLDVFRIRIRD